MIKHIGTPENREKARRMLDEGRTFYAIGREFGTRGEYIRRWFDPEFRAAIDAKALFRKRRTRAKQKLARVAA